MDLAAAIAFAALMPTRSALKRARTVSGYHRVEVRYPDAGLFQYPVDGGRQFDRVVAFGPPVQLD